MKRDSRRLFSSVEFLGRFSPVLLVRFANQHQRDFSALIESGSIPSEREADKINLAALVPLLTSTGITDELADALFLINAIATPKHRQLLEKEIARRRANIAPGADESTADFVMRVWLHDRTLLEAATARSTLISRRSFSYFVPADTAMAASIPPITPPVIESLSSKIRANLGPKGRGRGLTLIPYLDSPNADWFLIRRSRLPERITFHNEDETEEHKSVWFRVYDVVVFDRLTGVLKVNCREGIEDVYRTAFGSVLAGNMHFFEEKSIFTLEPLRSADVHTLQCRDASGLEHVALERVFFDLLRFNTLMRGSVETHDWYSEAGGSEAPIPPEAKMALSARFRVEFAHGKGETKLTIHLGNRLAFGRDEYASMIETFLIKRGFMQHVHLLRHDIAA